MVQSVKSENTLVTGRNAMTTEEIEARIFAIFRERFAVDEGRYSLAADFVSEFELDSYDTASLFMALEEEFSIDLEDQELERIVTVGDIHELVKRSLDSAPVH
jgi:acyl carrier protein